MNQPPPRKRAAKVQPDWPWQIPPIEDADIFALQAVARGIANEGQQRAAWDFITRILCRPDVMTFQPGGHEGERATSFAEGKRWVATQLRRFEKMRPESKNRENA